MHTTPFLTSSSPDIFFSFSFFLSFSPLLFPFLRFFFTCFSPSSLCYSFHTYTSPSRCQLHLRTHLPLLIFFSFFLFFLSFIFIFIYFLLFCFFSIISLIFHFGYLFLLVFCLVSVTASPWPPCFPDIIVVLFYHQHFRS